jgi:hypothetical protein
VNKTKLKEIREAIARMNALKAAGRPYDALRFEVIPRLVMPEIEFLVTCAERVMGEQKSLI